MTQAKDVPDEEFLRAVLACQIANRRDGLGQFRDYLPWAMTWDVDERMPEVPPKVLRAKAKTLIRRGLMDGCTCGCRGDYELTTAGMRFIIGEGPFIGRSLYEGKR